MLSIYASKNTPRIEDFNQIPVQITYQFTGSKLITKELFSVGSSFPSTKSITFDGKAGGLQLLIHYHDKYRLLPGLPNQIAQYEIVQAQVDQTKQVAKYSTVLTISNNLHNIPVLERVELVQEWVEVVKGKKQNMKTTDPIKFKLSSYALPPKEKQTFRE